MPWWLLCFTLCRWCVVLLGSRLRQCFSRCDPCSEKKKKVHGEQPSECLVVYLPKYLTANWKSVLRVRESQCHIFESLSATLRGLCRTHLYISFCLPRAVYLEPISWCCTNVSSAETSAFLCFSSLLPFLFVFFTSWSVILRIHSLVWLTSSTCKLSTYTI